MSAVFNNKKFYVIKYEYEQSLTNEYKRQHDWWEEEDLEETFIGPIIINVTKHVNLNSARIACRSQFHKIVSYELDWDEFMYEDKEIFDSWVSGYNDHESDTWEWVDNHRSYVRCGPDYLDIYSAYGEYYDNCWQWTASACIILSGEHSRLYVRNILLCLRSSGLSQVLQLTILCYLGILNKNYQVVEGAIEPY